MDPVFGSVAHCSYRLTWAAKKVKIMRSMIFSTASLAVLCSASIAAGRIQAAMRAVLRCLLLTVLRRWIHYVFKAETVKISSAILVRPHYGIAQAFGLACITGGASIVL